MTYGARMNDISERWGSVLGAALGNPDLGHASITVLILISCGVDVRG